MKQGKFYTKLILWIFLVAVICYFGYYIFSALYAPLTTTMAIEYEAGAGSYTTGFIVREEAVVSSQYGITTMVVSEGERVAVGETIATGYRTEDAQERQAQISQLEDQLSQLESAADWSADLANQAILDSEIRSSLADMSRYVARRDLNSAADRSATLKGLILRRMSSAEENAAMEERITTLKARLADLQTDATADTLAVTAEQSGYWSGTVDGYETVLTPEKLKTMTVDQFQSITEGTAPGDAVGKLISGSTWYYVTVVPSDQTTGIDMGDQVPVVFTSEVDDNLTMTVERLGRDEDGQRVLVLSCDRYMQKATLLRQQSADIVFTSYAGLRVPKEAIRVNENAHPGVYVLEGSAAVWKSVTILYDNGESYVVELDKSSTDNLWPGDEIIVVAKDLYPGKVVR